MIKYRDAFLQKLDFTKLFPFCVHCSDIDGVFKLNNGVIVILEIKKETESHKVENFIETNQYKLLRDLIGNRQDIYFVYATHNNIINKDIDIEATDCTVKFVRHGSIEAVIDSGIRLSDFIRDLSRNNDMFNDEYYIMVKYPNGAMRYCVLIPTYNRWITDNYSKEKNMFKSMKEVNDYIFDRFIYSENRKNEYWIFKKEEDTGTFLVDIRRYVRYNP